MTQFLKSTKTNTNRQLTVRSIRFIYGLIIAIFIAISPYLFYLYRLPPDGVQVYEIGFITINASGFYDVSSYLHALFTKIALVFLTSIAFLKINSFWKWSLLVPLVMFLYQLYAVLNSNWKVFDEYSLWKSLIITIPILIVLIYGTLKLNNRIDKLNIHDSVLEEYKSAINDTIDE